MALGLQVFVGDKGRRSRSRLISAYFRARPIAPCRERPSFGTHHVGASAAHWWRHFHGHQRLLGLIQFAMDYE